MRTRMFMAGLGFALALLFAGSANAGQPQASHPVVIELFTSQGCSDCPAADRIVAELAKRKDVLALSLPITYWDMLGWKDTFATEANTYRQKSYAKTMNRSGIYTPQIIVDGKIDVVGNQRDRVMSAIANRHTPDCRGTADQSRFGHCLGPHRDRDSGRRARQGEDCSRRSG